MKVAVIGGGIAGLTAAIACRRKGFNVTLYEAAPAIEEVGAGIQLSPNATSRLIALGLDLSGLEAMRPEQTELHSFNGFRLMRMHHDQAGDAPYLQLHRADLLDFLHLYARRLMVKIELGMAAEIVSGSVNSGFKVKAKTTRTFDRVISADGVHSSAVQREASSIRKTSQVAWRGLIDGENAPEEFKDNPRIILGARRHIVTYPLRGGALINLVAVEEVTGQAEQGWSHAADPAELRGIFSDFGKSTHALLQSVRSVRRWALCPHDHAMMEGAFGQPVIGDAALTMLPFMAQGAGMAIEDAFELAEDLGDGHKGWSANSARIRKERKEAVMKAARSNGRIFHFYPKLIGPFYHMGMAIAGRLSPHKLSRRYAWIYEDRV